MSKYFTTQDNDGLTIKVLKRDVSVLFGKSNGTNFYIKGMEGSIFSNEHIDVLTAKIEAKEKAKGAEDVC